MTTLSALDPARALPDDASRALLIGRLWQPGVGPTPVALRGDALVDLSRLGATVSELLEADDAARAIAAALPGAPALAEASAVLRDCDEAARDESKPWLLAPCDLQVIKAEPPSTSWLRLGCLAATPASTRHLGRSFPGPHRRGVGTRSDEQDRDARCTALRASPHSGSGP